MPRHIRHILMVQRGKFEKVLYEKRAKIQRKVRSSAVVLWRLGSPWLFSEEVSRNQLLSRNSHVKFRSVKQ